MMKATKKDKEQLVALLSSSFDDNRSVNYTLGNGPSRDLRRRKLMVYAFDTCLEFGEVYRSVSGNCCALIMFPDKKRFSFSVLIRDLRLICEVIGISRLFKVINRERMVRKHIFFDRVFHIWFIGTATSVQGMGEGTAMMKFLLREAKLLRRPVFLETSVDRNLNWYNSLGLEHYDTLDLGYALTFFRKFF